MNDSTGSPASQDPALIDRAAVDARFATKVIAPGSETWALVFWGANSVGDEATLAHSVITGVRSESQPFTTRAIIQLAAGLTALHYRASTVTIANAVELRDGPRLQAVTIDIMGTTVCSWAGAVPAEEMPWVAWDDPVSTVIDDDDTWDQVRSLMVMGHEWEPSPPSAIASLHALKASGHVTDICVHPLDGTHHRAWHALGSKDQSGLIGTVARRYVAAEPCPAWN